MTKTYSFFERYINPDGAKRQWIGQTIYYFSFAFFIVISMLQFSTFSEFVSMHSLNRLTYLPVGLVLCKIIIVDELNVKAFYQNVGLLILALLTMKLASSSLLVTLIVFSIGARDVDFYKILRIYYIVGSVTLLIIMFSAFSGVIANLIFYRGNIVRHAFGIVYPTDFASHVLSILLAFYCVNYQKLTIVHHLGVIIVSALVYHFCNSRLTSLTLLIMLVAFVFAKQASRGNTMARLVVSFFWGALPCLCYLAVSLSYLYTKNIPLFNKLNHLLSGRLILGKKAITKYGVTLFGQDVQERGWGKGAHAASNMSNYFFIDSSYLRFVIIYGLIIGLIILYWMTKVSICSFKLKQYGLCAAILVIAISAFVEQHFFELSYNPFVLSYFALLTPFSSERASRSDSH